MEKKKKVENALVESNSEEILNLDAFARRPIKIVYKGKTYPVNEISMSAYLALARIREKALDGNIEKQAETIIELIRELVPSLEEEVKNMNFKQILTLVNFLTQEITEVMSEFGEQEGNLPAGN